MKQNTCTIKMNVHHLKDKDGNPVLDRSLEFVADRYEDII